MKDQLRFYTVSCLFLISLLTLNHALFAQEEELILESGADYTFGAELRFEINIENAADVEKITLSVRPEHANNLYVIDIPFEPGSVISATRAIDVNAISLLPYSGLNYFLEIQTPEKLYKTPEETIFYEDDRFFWQQTSRDGLTAHWTEGGPFMGQDAILVAGEALARLAEKLPLEHISPIDIYIYPSTADLHEGLYLAGYSGETSSHPEIGVILVTSVNPQSAAADLGQSLPYEMTHLLLYRAAGEQYEDLPWWLKEGLATSVQAQPHPRYAQLIDEAVRNGQTIPIRQLCEKTERVGERELLASAQSYSLVNYLFERYGQETFVDLVRAYIQGDDCEMGVGRVLDSSIDELDDSWIAAQQPPTVVSRIFAEYGLWFLLILSGFGLMLLILRITWHRGRSE